MSAEQDAAREVSSLFKQNRFAELESAARRWLVEFPDASFLWKALGVACSALGKRTEALEAKQRAVELAPDDGEAIRVEISPGASTNSFVPEEALGAGIDRLNADAVQQLFTEVKSC